MTGDELFWDLAEDLYADPGVSRSTMMGLPCLRFHGRFFASLEHKTQALVVRLPQQWIAHGRREHRTAQPGSGRPGSAR